MVREAQRVLVAVALAGGAVAGRAAEPAHRDFALTVSGGVSLGAYEAGFLYYALEQLRANPELGRLRLLTGSSAGGTNAVIAALSACSAQPLDPEESPFWSNWIPLGWEALDGGDAPALQGALSRRGLLEAAERIRGTWEAGLPAGCDVVLGISATRVVPRVVRGGGELPDMPRVEEKFALRLRGRGRGRPPALTNYLDPRYRLEQLALPEGADGTVSFEALRDLLLASASFPVAFPPVPLRHCIVRPGAAPRCPEAEASPALFVDGGFFDNSPLRLAARLAAAGNAPGSPGGWRDAPQLDRFELPPGMMFGYVTPDATAWPTPQETAPIDEHTPLLRLLGQLAGAVVSGARTKELYTLLEEHPEIAERIAVPRTHYPTAGAPLAAFLGFFERDFRVFDFTLGMYESRRLFEDVVAPARRAVGAQLVPVPGSTAPGSVGWRRFACMRAVLDGAGDPGACVGDDLAQFRILLQASLERLYASCWAASQAGMTPDATEHASCRAAMRGEQPPTVPGVAGQVDFHRGQNESELAHFLRLLGGHGFVFHDLRAGTSSAAAAEEVRRRFGRLGNRLAAAQPVDAALAVGSATRMLANSLAYAPPRHELHLVLGREVELGGSMKLTEAGFLRQAWRAHLALQLHGVTTGLSSDRVPFAVAALGGVELWSHYLSSWRFQLTGGVRGGWILAQRDGFGGGTCRVDGRDRIGACSRPAAEAFLSAALLERVRLQLGAEWYPGIRAGEKGLWALSPGLGIQLTQ